MTETDAKADQFTWGVVSSLVSRKRRTVEKEVGNRNCGKSKLDGRRIRGASNTISERHADLAERRQAYETTCLIFHLKKPHANTEGTPFVTAFLSRELGED